MSGADTEWEAREKIFRKQQDEAHAARIRDVDDVIRHRAALEAFEAERNRLHALAVAQQADAIKAMRENTDAVLAIARAITGHP